MQWFVQVIHDLPPVKQSPKDIGLQLWPSEWPLLIGQLAARILRHELGNRADGLLII